MIMPSLLPTFATTLALARPSTRKSTIVAWGATTSIGAWGGQYHAALCTDHCWINQTSLFKQIGWTSEQQGICIDSPLRGLPVFSLSVGMKGKTQAKICRPSSMKITRSSGIMSRTGWGFNRKYGDLVFIYNLKCIINYFSVFTSKLTCIFMF